MSDKSSPSTKSINRGDLPSPDLYRRYRMDAMELGHKIIEATSAKNAIQFVAKALGMMGPGNVIVFDSEDETGVLMDCALYEYKIQGQNIIERYQEEIGGENEVERELLAAMVDASTSLFQVESISRETHTLILGDLVNEGRTITLMDINFSRTVKPHYLLFMRPIILKNFGMTSGFAFVFPDDMKNELILRWRRTRSRSSSRTRRALSTSLARYVAFFKLSQRHGIKVVYNDVNEMQDE